MALVVPRGPGVGTKLIHTSYSTAAGTAYVTFDNVRVPYENTLGKEGHGLQVILSNFNHERLVSFLRPTPPPPFGFDTIFSAP